MCNNFRIKCSVGFSWVNIVRCFHKVQKKRPNQAARKPNGKKKLSANNECVLGGKYLIMMLHLHYITLFMFLNTFPAFCFFLCLFILPLSVLNPAPYQRGSFSLSYYTLPLSFAVVLIINDCLDDVARYNNVCFRQIT